MMMELYETFAGRMDDETKKDGTKYSPGDIRDWVLDKVRYQILREHRIAGWTSLPAAAGEANPTEAANEKPAQEAAAEDTEDLRTCIRSAMAKAADTEDLRTCIRSAMAEAADTNGYHRVTRMLQSFEVPSLELEALARQRGCVATESCTLADLQAAMTQVHQNFQVLNWSIDHYYETLLKMREQWELEEMAAHDVRQDTA